MNYIDLFAGCGGLSLGLHNAGLKGLFAVEKNEDAFLTLKYNLIDNKNHFSWPDWLELKNWDINKLIQQHKKNLMDIKGTVDLIVGGPPCQGFSMAGKRDSEDLRNKLISAYIEFVRIIEPKALFFENVHGFTVAFSENENKKGIPYSLKLITELNEMGYSVNSSIINMSEYGVPQKRKRFILFASKGEESQNFFLNLQQGRESFFNERSLRLPVTIGQAISDLERVNGEIDSLDTKGFKNGKYSRKKSSYQKLMRKDLKRGAIPDSHRFAKHKKETEALFKKLMSVSNRSFRVTPSMGVVADLKKRGVTPLKKREICPTVTSIPDDFIHYNEPRIMTVREHARIQSFPDDYVFKGKYTTGGERRKVDVPRYTQVANAVPPLFAEQVGSAILKCYNN
ncbi:DNA cytosine methyltransferase [Enterococcus faecalis]|uniref:DNA cytosine methyltransferase n=1 Tax=Enterococcus faecalis TaxID=1351 RepID=UPI0012E242E6|nr:DNA cytosine methyltransferase [Enterococcus faecalis]EGO5015763.1 DNA cytosine methyltransferase [Enterococcus faecalis]EGO6562140.1 DNA cytosine methyltransferase [Enterococcus faecalis]EGO7560696.1 DNA cytosine methyltransferase [Enterococcus faecalis]EGO7742881.1 DNA cytosine methyltransferase [Enterococcus faecalis]EGO8093206.1 DNA cytosine methyltransferase [Enterococcus faecalis]